MVRVKRQEAKKMNSYLYSVTEVKIVDTYIQSASFSITVGNGAYEYTHNFFTAFNSTSQLPASASETQIINAIKSIVGESSEKTADSELEAYIARQRSMESEEERLAHAKAKKIREINQARDSEEQSGFLYLGKVIDSNDISVIRINTVVLAAMYAQALGQPFSIEWTTQDNSTLTLNANQVIGMPSALASSADALHQKARGLKALVNQANSLSEVEAVTWD